MLLCFAVDLREFNVVLYGIYWLWDWWSLCLTNLVMRLSLPSQIASEGLKHRVFEVSLADLQGDEDNAYRKIRLRAEDVQGRNVLCQFWVRNTLWTIDSQHLFLFFFWFLFFLFDWILTVFSVFICRAWTSPLTNLGHWLKNGRLWLRLMLMLKPLIATLSGCSASPSPRDVLTRSRGLATLNPAKSVRCSSRYYLNLLLSLSLSLES